MIALVLSIPGTTLCGGAKNLVLIEACWSNIDGLVSAMLTVEWSSGLVSSIGRALAATRNHKGDPQVEKDAICQTKGLTGYRLCPWRRMVARKACR